MLQCRPCDILNTEFENAPQDSTMKLEDIKTGGPDELDPEDCFQDLLIEGNCFQNILIEGPPLP